MDSTVRRNVLRYGSILLLIAFLLGLVAAAAPNGRAWFSAHMRALLGSFFLFFIGIIGSELNVENGTGIALGWIAVLTLYIDVGFAALTAAMGFGTRILIPGPQPEGWQALVGIVLLGVIDLASM